MFESLLFWEVLAFIIFVGVLFKPAREKILGLLDKRITTIRAEIEEAEKLREQAQSTLASFQRDQRDVAEKAQEMMAHAKEEAVRLQEKGLKDLAAALERRQHMAEESIRQAELEAVREIRARAVELAIASAAKVLSENIDDAKANALIERAVADFPAKLH